MKKLAFLTIISLVAAFYVTGDNLDDTELNTFTAGTPASASEVNENFDAAQAAINDNFTKINDNETGINSLSSDVSSLSTTVGSLSSTVSSLSTTVSTGLPRRATGTLTATTLTSSYSSQGKVTINAPTSGYVLVISTGMIQLSGKTTSGYASVYVGVSNNSTTVSSYNYTRFYLSASVSAGSYEIPFSVHSIFSVSSGNNTFYTLARESGSGSGTLYAGRISAIFIRY